MSARRSKRLARRLTFLNQLEVLRANGFDDDYRYAGIRGWRLRRCPRHLHYTNVELTLPASPDPEEVADLLPCAVIQGETGTEVTITHWVPPDGDPHKFAEALAALVQHANLPAPVDTRIYEVDATY